MAALTGGSCGQARIAPPRARFAATPAVRNGALPRGHAKAQVSAMILGVSCVAVGRTDGSRARPKQDGDQSDVAAVVAGKRRLDRVLVAGARGEELRAHEEQDDVGSREARAQGRALVVAGEEGAGTGEVDLAGSLERREVRRELGMERLVLGARGVRDEDLQGRQPHSARLHTRAAMFQ